jgi:ubiquinone/menaquinone biosynthesis C-methylase UbiE
MTESVWARGDYPKVSDDMIAPLGPIIVEAAGIQAGQRVLDVAAGCGNASIPAAERGASVVASDLTPELLAVGRERAAARGVSLDWVEADAEALPFEDGEFDAVISVFGVMFAPNHQPAADELVRVCRSGGTIGLASWTPEGSVGDFFRTLAAYAPPPPPGAQPGLLWGSPQHLDELFGERVEWTDRRVESLSLSEFAEPRDLCEYYKQNFGPTITIYESVRDDPERLAALDRDFLGFAERANRGEPGAARFEFDYLLTVGRKR